MLPTIEAELDDLFAELSAAGATNLGFPGATDFDVTPLARFLRFMINNVGDPRDDGIYPHHVKPQERWAVNIIADLLRAPVDDRWGYITSGTSEGTEHGLHLARTMHPAGIVYRSAAAHPVDRTTALRVCVSGMRGQFGAVPSTQRRLVRSCVVVGGVDRDVAAVVLPSWGWVVASDDLVGFVVVDPGGVPVEPIRRFLLDFVARGNSLGSVRSYAFGLHRWWRFLLAVGVGWDRATSAEVRDFVLWLRQARKSVSSRRTRSVVLAGTVNPVTRKRYLDDRYTIATVRHSNALLRTFYEFWIETGAGPLVNPVVRERINGRRAHAHHNPLQPLRAEGKLRYNPRLPRRRVRAVPEQRWTELFAAMRSHRDRAILALALSTGARASELLGLRGCDLDWGDQLIRVRRKGTQAEQWLPASSEAFVWLRLYLDEIGGVAVGEHVWATLRRRRQAGSGLRRQVLTYDALRAVFRRVNEQLGTNWTMHDLRHTCALRMVRDRNLTLRDVQTILGHAHLTTTQIYLVDDDQAVIGRVREHLATANDAPSAPPPVAGGYAPADLAVLLGEERR